MSAPHTDPRRLELLGPTRSKRHPGGTPCGCGCGGDIGGHSLRTRYLPGHRSRAHRKRLEADAERLGVPTRLTRQTLEAAASTAERHGDAPARPRKRQTRPRQGVTIYLPRPELVESLFVWVDALTRTDDGAREELAPDVLEAVVKARDRARAKRAER